IEKTPLPGIVARWAGERDVSHRAELPRAAIEDDVMTDEQVEPTVAVKVAKSRARAPSAISRDAGALRHVGEGAVVVVPVESVATVVRDKEIRPAVAVEVSDGAPHPIGVPAHARLRRHVGEGAVPVIPVERVMRLALLRPPVEVAAV